jgi:hypothetical protein
MKGEGKQGKGEGNDSTLFYLTLSAWEAEWEGRTGECC